MISPKVELHVHLDGALKHSTAYELLKKKNLSLPGDGSYQAFVDSVVVKTPDTLLSFLRGFAIFLPAVLGDLDALERMSYEFCEYQSADGVIYAEARYCPQLLIPEIFNEADFLNHSTSSANNSANGNRQTVTIRQVVEAVNRGFARGEKDFGIVVRSILCCIRGKPEWSQDILDLCVEFKGRGVVGIDIAGDEGGVDAIVGEEQESRMLDKEDIAVFNKAAALGVHRTVHAGEVGTALMVWKAVDVLKAERVGHGYHALDDDKIYEECLARGVHFECCPTSSLLTGAVALKDENAVHPIMRLARDNASFSINTDDPTVTDTKLSDEYNLLTRWGLSVAQIQQSNINAMKHSFAEPEVKADILDKLYAAYGIQP